MNLMYFPLVVLNWLCCYGN